MNDRLSISGNIPADRAEVFSDRPVVYWDEQARLDDMADAIEAENERMAEINSAVWVKDADFWKDELLDSNLGFLAEPLAECMAQLQHAINGSVEARSIIHRALHQIERQAKPIAEKQLIDIYGSEA